MRVVVMFYCIYTKKYFTFFTGVVVTGWFIVTVWGYMTCKWGFLLYWYAKKYQRALMDEVNDILSVNS